MTTSLPLVALITGAAHGVGLETGRRLVGDGYHVVLAARDPAAAADAADQIGATYLPAGLDITDPAGVASAAAAMTAEPGRLDVLINNAAAYVDWSETAATADLDAAHAVIETNLFGAWRMIQAFLPLLRAAPAARIVNLSSGAGSHGDTAFGLAARGGSAASYGISKAALNALTTTLAAELAGTDILVNAVCPGLTATWPGAEAMGARPAADSATGVVWAATLPAGGPTGGLFRDGTPLAW